MTSQPSHDLGKKGSAYHSQRGNRSGLEDLAHLRREKVYEFLLWGAHAARVFCWAARPTAFLGKIGGPPILDTRAACAPHPFIHSLWDGSEMIRYLFIFPAWIWISEIASAASVNKVILMDNPAICHGAMAVNPLARKLYAGRGHDTRQSEAAFWVYDILQMEK